MSIAVRCKEPVPLATLGDLESQVLERLWEITEVSGRGVLAREVRDSLRQRLAYTTITTTLDRLCKKNLVDRVKDDRAFVYTPRYSRSQLNEMEARRAIRQLASGGQLVSCLVDAVAQQDAALLDELEETIRRKRRDLARRSQ